MGTQLLKSERGLRLRDILPHGQVVGAEEIFVRSCCGVWKDCQADDLYVAIVDADEDGHEFTHEAIARGAGAIVTERLLTTRRPQYIVSDTREAYGRICQALAGQPSRRLKTIAVSGSDGKTVTSHLIRSIFESAQRRPGLANSIEVQLGPNRTSVPPQELNSPRLAEQLTQMALGNCATAVVEVSSVDLAKRCLAGVDLDVAVLTNIRHNELEFHGSALNYRRAQVRLLDHLKPDGVAVLNADDPTSHFLINRLRRPTLTFGIKQDANVTAVPLDRSPSQQTFLLRAGSESVPIRTAIVGDQHIQNCLAAAAVGLAQGLDLVTIADGLNRVQQIPGRLERITCGQDFGVWIDSSRTPNQLATAIQSIKRISTGKIWCLGTVDEGQSAADRRRLGEVLERAADITVLTRTVGQETIDYEPLHQVLDGFSHPEKARVMPNRFKAIEWVLQNAQPDDAVLVSGLGDRPFALVGEESWTIKDRDVCEAWLYDHASLAPMQAPVADANGIYRIDDYRDVA